MLDVDGWLSAIGPEVIDRWMAFEKLERAPEDEMRRLIEIVKLGFVAVCAAWGKRIEPDDLDPMPQDRKQEHVGPAGAKAMLGGLIGGGQ